MTEPVPQGYAQKSQTLFTLLPPADSSQAIDTQHVSLSSSPPEDDQTEDDDEGLEIGENFLASSLIPQPSSYSRQNDSSTIRVSRLAQEFTANLLSTPISLDLDEYTMYVRTVDLPKVGVLDGDWVSSNAETCSGDMSDGCQAIAQLPSSRSRRLIRLEANDEVVCDSYGLTFSRFPLLADLSLQRPCQSFSYTLA